MNSASVATLARVLLLGAMSPGPSFWLVVQLALRQSRRVALGAALGMGLGAVCFAMLAALGWQSWLPPPWLQALRLAGAAFLCWLGYRLVVWLVEAGWYALVACAFSSAGIRQRYLRQQPMVDRLAASAMLCLGLWLAFTA